MLWEIRGATLNQELQFHKEFLSSTRERCLIFLISFVIPPLLFSNIQIKGGWLFLPLQGVKAAGSVPDVWQIGFFPKLSFKYVLKVK